MGHAQNRQKAIDQFWSDVKGLLTGKTGKYHHSPQKSQQEGIEKYRQEVNRLDLGGVVYNQGEEQTARVIDGLIEHGLPTPSAS